MGDKIVEGGAGGARRALASPMHAMWEGGGGMGMEEGWRHESRAVWHIGVTGQASLLEPDSCDGVCVCYGGVYIGS